MIGYCGECANYRERLYGENICAKTGKIVGYLHAKGCFEEPHDDEEEIQEPKKEETTMEQIITTKVCKECGRELPISMFGGNHKSPDGHLNTCKDCMSKKHRATSPKHKDASKKVQERVESIMDMDKLEKESEANPLHFVENCLKSYKDEVLVKELRDRGWEVKCTKFVEL